MNYRASLLGRWISRSPLASKYFWVPKGVLPTARHCLNRTGPSQGIGSCVKEVTTPRSSTTPLAQFPGVPDHPLFVALLNRAKVVGDVLLVATEHDEIIGGVQGLHGVQAPEDHWVCKRVRFRQRKRLSGTALLLAAANGANYYHWLIESLPRLHIAQEGGHLLKDVDWVLLNETTHQFHHHTLDLLGIPVSKRLCCKKSELMEVENLIVPSMPGFSGRCPPWVREFLRRQFLPVEASAPDAKLYISRKTSQRRRMINEAELEQALQQLGFQVVVLERLSFEEQVAVMAGAQLIVAPHGAGLANLVFTPPGGHLIELFHPEHFGGGCYEHLANVCGIGYQRIVGRSALSKPTGDVRKSVFSISIQEVLEVLAPQIGCHI